MKLAKGAVLSAVAVVAAGAALLVGVTSGRTLPQHTDPASVAIPKALDVPSGNRQVALLDAKGVQVYSCTGRAWKLLEPAATLWNHNGLFERPMALHSRGPVWVSTVDGSAVKATAVANVPEDGAVPELLLKATATRGPGVLDKVSYVQRLATSGGLAPTTACSGSSQLAVPYSATYAFYTHTARR
jgi:Protein of unknown function (DUF3455)